MQAENLYNGASISGCKFSFWLPMPQNALKDDPTDPVSIFNPLLAK
jgi:hypothetical protein